MLFGNSLNALFTGLGRGGRLRERSCSAATPAPGNVCLSICNQPSFSPDHNTIHQQECCLNVSHHRVLVEEKPSLKKGHETVHIFYMTNFKTNWLV